MPSRAYTSFLPQYDTRDIGVHSNVSMPSRAYTSFLQWYKLPDYPIRRKCVNALSGLYLISTWNARHFYDVAVKSVNALSGLYLISTIRFMQNLSEQCFACQCPLGLIPHFYVEKYSINVTSGMSVSMPSRAYTSFLRYPFNNLGFMRFPEPVFAGIYQNILTTAVFRAC